RMVSELFERVHPGTARKSVKKCFACKAWKSKSFSCLVFISLLLAPNLSTSAQPPVRIAQANNTLPFVSVYAARANGYFDEEGCPAELIIVQGGTHIGAPMGGSVDFDATSTGGLLRAFRGGTDLLGIQNFRERCVFDLFIRKDRAKRLGITPAMPVLER